MLVLDCFSFFNELDLLEIRLNELHDVVDYFVLVEASVTHSGKLKPLYYNENQERFKEFKSQILHLIVYNMPMTHDEIQLSLSSQDRRWLESGYQKEDSWVRERYQRNAMMLALANMDDDDIVIIEDADEMVKREVLQDIRSTIVAGSNAVEQVFHTYYLNWKCTNMRWQGSKILQKKFITTPSEVRFHIPMANNIMDGGWHFNYLGGADAIRTKIQSFAHTEFNVPSVLDNIDSRLANKRDALGRLYQYVVVPIDETYPKYIRENLDKFDSWIYHG